jgi:hypothetical protein
MALAVLIFSDGFGSDKKQNTIVKKRAMEVFSVNLAELRASNFSLLYSLALALVLYLTRPESL